MGNRFINMEIYINIIQHDGKINWHVHHSSVVVHMSYRTAMANEYNCLGIKQHYSQMCTCKVQLKQWLPTQSEICKGLWKTTIYFPAYCWIIVMQCSIC
jgi:hypothetical protein